MGKKKFLNKKKSAVFTLVYRDTAEQNEDAAENPIRQFVRLDRGDAHVPGFSEDDPFSQVSSEYLDEHEEQAKGEATGDDDSRFNDAGEVEEEDDDDEDEGEGEGSSSQAKRGRNDIATKNAARSTGLPENIRRELIELGFPDDGYDYNQHMRNTLGASAAFVPSTRVPDPLRADVKAYDASNANVQHMPEAAEAEVDEVELVSSVSRPVRKPLWKDGVLDDDIVAALDNSDHSQFDSADELDDEFMVFASEGIEDGRLGLSGHEESSSGPSQTEKDAGRGTGETPRIEDEDVEDDDELWEQADGLQKERPIRLLDEQFETLALHEYDDLEVDELDEDDPLAKGHADISQFSSVLSEFLNDSGMSFERYETMAKSHDTPYPLASISNHEEIEVPEGKASNANMVANRGVENAVVKKTIELGNKESEEELVTLEESETSSDEWDCDTVVSCYSNLDNHPGKIGAPGRAKDKLPSVEKSRVIRLGGKQQLPLDYLPAKPVDAKQGGKPSGNVARSRAGETPEERKARKASIKVDRKEARKAKKATKLCYRDGAQKAQHGAAMMGPSTIHLP